MNQMKLGMTGDERSAGLTKALYASRLTRDQVPSGVAGRPRAGRLTGTNRLRAGGAVEDGRDDRRDDAAGEADSAMVIGSPPLPVGPSPCSLRERNGITSSRTNVSSAGSCSRMSPERPPAARG